MSYPQQPGHPRRPTGGYPHQQHAQYPGGPQYPQYPPPSGGPQYGPPQAQQWPPQQPQPKKRRKWPWVVGALLALIVIGSALGSGGGSPAGTAPAAGAGAGAGADAPAASSLTTSGVVYEITGSGRASNVTYSTDGSGSISQENGVSLPWRKEVSVDRGFSIVSLSAQNGGSGELTCRISVDGEVVKEATSSGQYALVSCTSDPI